MEFCKYHSLGNDYLVYDSKKNQKELEQEEIVRICSRNFGIGSDGIVAGPYMEGESMHVRVYNPDGTEAEQGGNALRIFSHYLKAAGYIRSESFTLYTKSGSCEMRYLNRQGNRIQMTMGQLSFDSETLQLSGPKREAVHEYFNFGGEEYDCTCVSIGNPHCVIFTEKADRETICSIGKYSETADYFPQRINTQVVKVLDKNNIQIEVFERGVGYTLASASGACAAAGAAYKRGLINSDVMVHMPGGKLWTQIDQDWKVKMIGSVKPVCRIELFEDFFVG
ncbi:MAG TPA: diaminopimelate epimerase [Candidatus Blautia pullicola]|uniref:Diaminopimelate epimerase n=1 Tax=Candidatus Blautia pullicola TaxID=2838498 RepID=A0A9D2JR81_9FIRM|nr:diaminopimelate epimerase [Candidatus Blautia pullicola]